MFVFIYNCCKYLNGGYLCLGLLFLSICYMILGVGDFVVLYIRVILFFFSICWFLLDEDGRIRGVIVEEDIDYIVVNKKYMYV